MCLLVCRRSQCLRCMAVVKEICRARKWSSFLHDDYSDIAYININVHIDIETITGRGSQHRPGGEWEDLVIVTQCFGVWKE